MTLTLKGITKRFGATLAVIEVDLALAAGELFVLLGPSGCGKTTVLRLIAGLECPDHGSIVAGDREWSELSPQARDVAMVFQGYALYPHRSVRENIEYPLKLRGTGVTERSKLIDEVASLLEIQALLERSPRTLSGGEAQRVAVARALVRKPSCFLLDEPLSSLDSQMRMRARIDIKRIQKKLGVTALYVTHDQDEAVALADRIGIMKSGRLLQIGTPEEIVRRPANTFVAGFLGRPPMNLLRGAISRRADGGLVAALDITGSQDQPTIALSSHTADLPEGRVLVGLRPHDVEVRDSFALGGEPSGWLLKAHMSLSEGLDPDFVTYFDTPAGPVIARINHKLCKADVSIFLPLMKAHFFKENSGERLEITA